MKERKITYTILKSISMFLINLVYRPKILGKENIPNSGAIILAGNHINALDPVIAASGTNRIVHFMAKEEVSKGFHGKLFDLVGIIRVYKDRNKNIKSIITANNRLKTGGALGIFPEGTRNRTDKALLKLHFGAVTIAIKSNAKIVPFAIRGVYKPFKNGLEIEFGKPLDVSNMTSQTANDYLKNTLLKLLKVG